MAERLPKIKVLLVDDVLVATTLMKRALSATPDIEVVGAARNGREALELIPRLSPTVVCTDLHMPIMDGVELTNEIMSRFPRPVLAVSTSVEEGSSNAFRLIEAGALDLVSKPRIQSEAEFSSMARELANKIRILAGVKVFRKNLSKAVLGGPPVLARPTEGGPSEVSQPYPKVSMVPDIAPNKPLKIIVIGASTGGPQVLKIILEKLPSHFPYPVVCVQHISLGFLKGLVDWLAPGCRLSVTIAQNAGLPVPGNIYFPQEERHLKFDSRGRFDISNTPSGFGEASHIPSIDTTMLSAVECFGSGVLGVLLTGMGSDGAVGMKAIAQKGGLTIAQDEKSCTVFGMPKQAIELGAAKHVLPPEKIAEFLSELKIWFEEGAL